MRGVAVAHLREVRRGVGSVRKEGEGARFNGLARRARGVQIDPAGTIEGFAAMGASGMISSCESDGV